MHSDVFKTLERDAGEDEQALRDCWNGSSPLIYRMLVYYQVHTLRTLEAILAELKSPSVQEDTKIELKTPVIKVKAKPAKEKIVLDVPNFSNKKTRKRKNK